MLKLYKYSFTLSAIGMFCVMVSLFFINIIEGNNFMNLFYIYVVFVIIFLLSLLGILFNRK